MTYDEARSYISQVSRSGSVLGLESIKNLMEELSNVQEKLSIIHIGGTNGKGSTGAFIEAGLMEAGYSVGRYTSPAVFEPLEVWRINKKNISTEEYAGMLTKVRMACERMQKKGMPYPTVFEVETALAFLYFYEKKCDYVLLEVGMGGSTDATNLITKPVCAVLTSISMDHMQFLGNTLKEIALVKSGIIKKDCKVVTTEQKTEVMEVVSEQAKKQNATLLLARDIPEVGEIQLQMKGEYQLENARLAITVLHDVLQIPREAIRNGIGKATWPGRFETLQDAPLFIIDGAHNEDAAEKLYATLQKYFTNRKITYIIGVLADKEHEKMLEKMLPLAQKVYTVTPGNPRAFDGKLLAEEARKYHEDVTACDSVAEAVQEALNTTDKQDVILAFGSLSYLGEVKRILI